MARVMVVDDSLTSRILMKALAENAGHEVVAMCDNGWDALEKIAALGPDIVFLDMLMPHMDGLEVLKRLAHVANRPKVIMLSSVSTRDKILTARDAGADMYVIKPFTADKVHDAVARCLEGGPGSHAAS